MKFEQIRTPEQLNIRELTPNDWEQYRNIRLIAMQTDPRTFSATFEEEKNREESYWVEMLSKKGRSTYGAYKKDDLAAIATHLQIDSDNYRISGVYTLEQWRGKNLSTDLITRLIDDIKKKGAKKISLNVNTKNDPAVHLYEKLGFKIVGTRKDIKMGDGNVHSQYQMELDLQKANNL